MEEKQMNDETQNRKEQINKDKQKLVKYLYPTKQIMFFTCNDLYQELLELIPIDICISEDNLDSQTRLKNFGFVQGVINGFLLTNQEYLDELYVLYKHYNIESIVYDILIGFVLYISSVNKQFMEVDILKDEQSIIYGEQFILDLIV